MNFSTTTRRTALALAATAALLAGQARAESRFSAEAVAKMSPAAEVVKPFEAMMLGEQYVASHAGTEFMVGSGSSMLPLYRPNTVIVVKHAGMSELKAGMTVVYVNDEGRAVAHALVKKTSEGWVAMGVGNPSCDETRVTGNNLVGIVIKAFQPSVSPMVALLNEAGAQNQVASTL